MRKMLSDLILDLAKFPNWKTFTFTFLCFLSVLVHIKQSTKTDFPLHFQILRKRVQGFFFKLGCRYFLPNGFYLPNKQPWGSQKFKF